MTAAPTRPLLRYHGGKWMLAPWIIGHFPAHRVYVEPFGGAGSVLLRKPRSYSEVWNDLDGEIANLFRVVRDNPRALTRAVLWTPFSREEYFGAFAETDDSLEAARRVVVRSFMSHGSDGIHRPIRSGFRSNAHRNNTTPARDWATFPPTIRAVARRFRGVAIEQRPATEVIAQHDRPDTLFYCDPPYVHASRSRSNGHGYRHELTDADHEALSEQLHAVHGMVVLSGYRSALYDRMYAGWATVEREALADGAAPRTEVLWLNQAAVERLSAGPLFAGTSA